MANEDLDGSPPPEQIEELLPSRTTEEIVAALVAGNPKHSITLAQRVAQMTALLKHEGPDQTDDYQRLYELRVEQIGGDPDEMMVGNRPRYTMDEDTYAIKDHETGKIHYGDPAPSTTAAGEALDATVPEPEGGVTGRLGAIPAPGLRGSEAARDSTPGQSIGDDAATRVDGETVRLLEACEHSWPDPVEAETPCSKCSLKFGQWVAS